MLCIAQIFPLTLLHALLCSLIDIFYCLCSATISKDALYRLQFGFTVRVYSVCDAELTVVVVKHTPFLLLLTRSQKGIACG